MTSSLKSRRGRAAPVCVPWGIGLLAVVGWVCLLYLVLLQRWSLWMELVCRVRLYMSACWCVSGCMYDDKVFPFKRDSRKWHRYGLVRFDGPKVKGDG